MNEWVILFNGKTYTDRIDDPEECIMLIDNYVLNDGAGDFGDFEYRQMTDEEMAEYQ